MLRLLNQGLNKRLCLSWQFGLFGLKNLTWVFCPVVQVLRITQCSTLVSAVAQQTAFLDDFTHDSWEVLMYWCIWAFFCGRQASLRAHWGALGTERCVDGWAFCPVLPKSEERTSMQPTSSDTHDYMINKLWRIYQSACRDVRAARRVYLADLINFAHDQWHRKACVLIKMCPVSHGGVRVKSCSDYVFNLLSCIQKEKKVVDHQLNVVKCGLKIHSLLVDVLSQAL